MSFTCPRCGNHTARENNLCPRCRLLEDVRRRLDSGELKQCDSCGIVTGPDFTEQRLTRGRFECMGAPTELHFRIRSLGILVLNACSWCEREYQKKGHLMLSNAQGEKGE